MIFSLKSVVALSSVALATLTKAAVVVPAGSSAITSNCSSATAAVTLLGVCVCVDILDIPFLATDCSSCSSISNGLSDPVCVGISLDAGIAAAGVGVCGCECASGTYAVIDGTSATCYEISGCSGSAGVLSTSDTFGYQTCTCSTGYTWSDTSGACVAAASANARRRSRKSQIIPEKDSDAFFCPNDETACPIGSGYECIDTKTSLDSCGGCLSGGGVNCLAIPGALGVSCVDARCVVSSCFPGWSFVDGQCIKN